MGKIRISEGLLYGNSFSLLGSNNYKVLDSFVNVWINSVLSGTRMLGHKTEQRMVIESDLCGSGPLFEHRRVGDTTTYIDIPCFCEKGTRLDDLIYLATNSSLTWMVLRANFPRLTTRAVRSLKRFFRVVGRTENHVTLLMDKDINCNPDTVDIYDIGPKIERTLELDRYGIHPQIDTYIFLYAYTYRYRNNNKAKLITNNGYSGGMEIDLSFSRNKGSICNWELIDESRFL